MNTINIAVLSAWHVHAEEYAKALQQVPGVRLCCLWDDEPVRGQAMAAALGIPFEPRLDAVFENASVDAVQVTTQTSVHKDVMLRAARAGKHIFTEKVLALSVEDAEAVARAIKQSGVRFAISFPHLMRPASRQAKALLESGALGTVGYARVRNAHNGATAGWLPERFYNPDACGGGAMIDLGAHPMYTLLWLLGEPQSVQSTFTRMTGKPVEDNAVSVLRYPDGAIAVSETSFVASHNPYTLEISGSQGYVLVQGDMLYAATQESDDKLIEITDLPPAAPSPLRQWAQSLVKGDDVDFSGFDIGAAVRLTRLMAQAYQSQ